MALKNPLGRIKDATFSTLKHPLGAAAKAVGTVGQVPRLIASRRQVTEPGPRIADAAPAPAAAPSPARPARGTRAPAEKRPEVDATPADVAALVAKKAPARKPADQKKAPATKSAAKKTAGRTSTAKRAANAPGDKLPFSRPPEG